MKTFSDNKILDTIRTLSKFCFAGLVVMWLVFWYISGSYTGMFKFFFTYYVSSQYFMDPPSKTQLFEGALKGMVNALGEPHSQYLDKEDLEAIKQATESTYSGVGIVLGKRDSSAEVVSAVSGQPAAEAGIQSGDLIKAVDGVETSKLTLEETSKRIRGEADSIVVLTIVHDGVTKDYNIVRKRITLPTVEGKMLGSNIGYIRISQFAELTGSDFKKTYLELQEKGMKKLILDLRNNPGGLVTTARDVADYILPSGDLVSIKSRIGKTEVYESQGLGSNIPLVVLINKGSASASEIIAGAVQDREAGTIIGTNSYGKGTVQTVIPALDNEGVKITIAKYHTPKDRVIDGIGINPDIEVVLTDTDRQSGIDSQLNKALEIIGGSK